MEFYLCSLSLSLGFHGLLWGDLYRFALVTYSNYGILGGDFVLFGRWVIINASENVLPPSSWQKMWREQLSSIHR